MKLQRMSYLVLTLLLLGLTACGTLEMGREAAPNTDAAQADAPTADSAATVEAAVQATVAAQGGSALAKATPTAAQDSATATALPATSEATPTAASSAGATVSTTPTWGEPLCLPDAPICIRPFAIGAFGADQQRLRVELYGTAQPVTTQNYSLAWAALDGAGDAVDGRLCDGSLGYDLFASYQQGFGHLSDYCFDLAERPQAVRLRLYSRGETTDLTFEVGADETASATWNHLAAAQPLAIGQPVRVGGATMTVASVEDQGDALVLSVTIEAGETFLVSNPDLITIGPTLRFYTVDELGQRVGWHNGRMGSYDPLVGGRLDEGESQQGYVVLEKAGASPALLVTFDGQDAAILQLPQE